MRAIRSMQPDSPDSEAAIGLAAAKGRAFPDLRDRQGGVLSTQGEKTRLEFLQETLARNPDETFARYGLALELAKIAPEEAWKHFEYLLTRHPEYSATYYQAGMFLIQHGRREEAQKVLAQGVDVTRRQGKQHAQSELQAALDELRAES